jgi:hypothetical protein
MPGLDTMPVDDYLRVLGDRLRGPAKLKADLLTEARHSLLDSAESYRAGGLPPADAERAAVAEFGSVPELTAGYQAELVAGTLRTLALRIAVIGVVLTSATDLMWLGAPWTRTGPAPPAGYRLLSESLNWAWAAAALVAIASYGWLAWTARRGRPGSVRLARAIGHTLTGSAGLGSLGGMAIFAWSLGIWDAALSWPPMIVGIVGLAAAYGWLGGAARSCRAASR